MAFPGSRCAQPRVAVLPTNGTTSARPCPRRAPSLFLPAGGPVEDDGDGRRRRLFQGSVDQETLAIRSRSIVIAEPAQKRRLEKRLDGADLKVRALAVHG